ncbi:MAG: tetratricopeptide repeat protein [Bacteroidales bacterium]
MKKLKLILAIFFTFSFIQYSIAQEEEENETIEEKNQYSKMQDSLLKIANGFESIIGGDNDDSDEPEFEVPKRNVKLLDALPKQIFSKEQLLQHTSSLLKNFETLKANAKFKDNVLKNFPPSKTKDYQQAAVILWFNGCVIETLYAFLKSAQNNDDCLALNNLSALLNLTGYPHKSIPILKYLLEKNPKSKIVLNNIGQAYYELGEMDEAMRYLTACTGYDRFNVQANNTIGHIEQSRGNTQQAIQAYSNSMNGGYNNSAASNLKRLKPDSPFKSVKMPDPGKYPPSDDNIPFFCPQPPVNPTEVIPFQAQMTADADEWKRVYDEYDEELNNSMQDDAQNLIQSVMNGGTVQTGMSFLFDKAVLIIGQSYLFTIEQGQRFENEHVAWQNKFMKEKGEAFKLANEQCSGLSDEACCAIINKVAIKYNTEAQNHFKDYCGKLWSNARGHYNVVAYWTPYLSSKGGLLYRDLYTARGMLIGTAGKLCSESMFGLSQGCDESEITKESKKKVEFKTPQCKTFNIPLGVGSIELGCDKFKASGGEGIVGELGLDFSTGQVTIGMGVGFEANTGVFNISQKDLAFVEFNTDNMSVTDFGSKASVELSAGKVLEPIGVNVVGIEGTVQSGFESGISGSGSVKAFDQVLFDL